MNYEYNWSGVTCHLLYCPRARCITRCALDIYRWIAHAIFLRNATLNHRKKQSAKHSAAPCCMEVISIGLNLFHSNASNQLSFQNGWVEVVFGRREGTPFASAALGRDPLLVHLNQLCNSSKCKYCKPSFCGFPRVLYLFKPFYLFISFSKCISLDSCSFLFQSLKLTKRKT